MDIDKQTAAIVAAQLTAAHCALYGPMPNPDQGDLQQIIRDSVEAVYAGYLARIDRGAIHLVHPV